MPTKTARSGKNPHAPPPVECYRIEKGSSTASPPGQGERYRNLSSLVLTEKGASDTLATKLPKNNEAERPTPEATSTDRPGDILSIFRRLSTRPRRIFFRERRTAEPPPLFSLPSTQCVRTGTQAGSSVVGPKCSPPSEANCRPYLTGRYPSRDLTPRTTWPMAGRAAGWYDSSQSLAHASREVHHETKLAQ